MKAPVLALALLAAGNVPAQAQDAPTPLSENQIEFLAEMLAMGAACSELGFTVSEERVGEWATERLSAQPESDIEKVVALRDTKIIELRDATQQVRDMPRGNARQRAMDEHYSRMSTRCNRMAEHSIGRNFITRY
jgi:hypothetical protein